MGTTARRAALAVAAFLLSCGVGLLLTATAR
jgi:hypothetical protein